MNIPCREEKESYSCPFVRICSTEQTDAATLTNINEDVVFLRFFLEWVEPALQWCQCHVKGQQGDAGKSKSSNSIAQDKHQALQEIEYGSNDPGIMNGKQKNSLSKIWLSSLFRLKNSFFFKKHNLSWSLL